MSDFKPTEMMKPQDRYSIAWTDWRDGATNVRLWRALAWHEISQRYKRTWIGVGWIAVSFTLFTSVKIFVFGALSGETTASFAVHLILGFLVFRLLSAFVTGGATVFVSSQNWIKSEPLPITIHLFRLMATNFISFFIAGIPAVVAVVLVGYLNWVFVLSVIPALVLFATFGVAIAAIMGTFCARYRDVIHFVATVMQILYFMTPILWVVPETGPRAMAAKFNPLTHFIELLRYPALEGAIPWVSWQIAGLTTIAVMIVAFLLFGHSRSKLIFWL